MEITLEKIELVKDRTGVSYKEAKEALEQNDGNVVDAIISIEEKIDINFKSGEEKEKAMILEKLKELVKRGNVSKIILKKDGDVILNLPVNAGILGAIGAAFAPWLAVAGIGAAVLTKCTVEVIKDNGEIIDVTEFTNEKFNDFKQKSTEVMGDVKDKAEGVYSNVKEKVGDAVSKKKEADSAQDELDSALDEDEDNPDNLNS